MADKRALIVIPARKNSKRVAGKNTIDVAGRPLIAHTLAPALQSRLSDRIAVTTDDPQVRKISREHGIEVLERPARLASDESKMIDVILDVLSKLKAKRYVPDIVVLLQPTSPLRTAADIDTAISVMLYTNADSVMSVCEVKPSPKWSFELRKKGPKYLFKSESEKRSQELNTAFAPNGAIFAATTKVILERRSFQGKRLCPMIMDMERSVDIDEYSDIKVARDYLERYGSK